MKKDKVVSLIITAAFTILGPKSGKFETLKRSFVCSRKSKVICAQTVCMLMMRHLSTVTLTLLRLKETRHWFFYHSAWYHV